MKYIGNSLDGRGYHNFEDGEKVCSTKETRKQSQEDWRRRTTSHPIPRFTCQL